MFRIAIIALLAVGASPSGAAIAGEDLWAKTFHRGEFVHLALHNGHHYHLRLTAICDDAVVGRSGETSVRIPREQIELLEREKAPAAAPLPASTAAMALLGLTAVTQGAAANYGTGRACGQQGTEAGC